MSKFEVSYSDNAIVFVNIRTNKAEKLDLLDTMDAHDAIRAIRSEQNAAVSASRAAVSLLCTILDNPRLDEYRGACDVSAAVPAELKAAIRELETEYLKPLFVQPLLDKGAKPATAEKQWQDYAKGLKEGGSYAVAKGHVTKLFAYTGKLPMHNGKILTVAAIKKLIENIEKPESVNEGIAGKLVALASELSNADADKMGDFATAIAALKSMLGTYEACYRDSLEVLTATIGNTDVAESPNDIAAQANAIAAQAYSKFTRASVPMEEATL